MVGKKGMSPIIATILLIAFAVALGAMIMNIGGQIASEGGLEKACEESKLRVRTAICFSNNKIKVDVVNTGETDFEGLIFRIQTADQESDIKISTPLKKGAVLVKEISHVKPEEFTINLIPIVFTDGEDKICPEPIYTTDQLPQCT